MKINQLISFAVAKKSFINAFQQLTLILFYLTCLTLIVNKPSMNMLMFGFQIYFTVSRIYFLFQYFNNLYRHSIDKKKVPSMYFKYRFYMFFLWEYWIIKRACK